MLRDHEQIRMELGFDKNDAPSPLDEDWGLRFYEPHGSALEGPMAALGIKRDWNDNKMLGFVFARGKGGGEFFAPRK